MSSDEDPRFERPPAVSYAVEGPERHTHVHVHIDQINVVAPGEGNNRGGGGRGGAGGGGDRRGEGGGSRDGDRSRDDGDSEEDDSKEHDSKNADSKHGDSKDGDSKKDGSKKDDSGDDDSKKDEKPHSKRPLIILAVVVVIAAIVALIFWLSRRNEVRTDDAYTDGNSITMAPKVSGYVIALYVSDNTRVKKGDLLVKIEPSDYLASQAEANAQISAARAQLSAAEVAYEIARVQYPAQLAAAKAQQRAAETTLAQAESSYKRQHDVDRRATTQDIIDQADSQAATQTSNLANAKSQLAVAALVTEQLKQAAATVEQRRASLQQAEAQLKQADLNVGYTEIRAPSDGFITKRNVQQGTYLAAGAAMFLIVTPDLWVTANFKESQLDRMRPGDLVDLEVDAYPNIRLEGHVQSVQQGSGSRFSAFPVENATGNFVKIVQRVPVKIVIDRGLDANIPLPLGLSVSPVVHLR